MSVEIQMHGSTDGVRTGENEGKPALMRKSVSRCVPREAIERTWLLVDLGNQRLLTLPCPSEAAVREQVS